MSDIFTEDELKRITKLGLEVLTSLSGENHYYLSPTQYMRLYDLKFVLDMLDKADRAYRVAKSSSDFWKHEAVDLGYDSNEAYGTENESTS